MLSVDAPTFEALPAALHLHLLSFLPLVGRVRCALVSRSWAALLADPAFWAEMRFDGAAEHALDDVTRLRALDVSDRSCASVTLDGVLRALAFEGSGLALQSLSTWAPPDPHLDPHNICSVGPFSSAAAAAALLAACPALSWAAVGVEGQRADVVAILDVLPGPGGKRISIQRSSADYLARAEGVPALSEWLPAALAAASISEVELKGPYLDHASSERTTSERAKAQLLGAALAAPERGVRVLRCAETILGITMLPESICRALTADSPLEELHLTGCVLCSGQVAEIASALAPGRSRLKTLVLTANNLMSVECNDGRAPSSA